LHDGDLPVTGARLAVLVFAFSVNVIACADAADAPDDANTPDASEVPTVAAFRERYCALIDPCCSAAGRGSCGATVNEAASLGTYDPQGGADCVQKLEERRGSADFCETLTVDMLSSLTLDTRFCGPVFRTPGNVAPGGECSWDADCRADPGGVATCLGTTCTVVVDGKAGDACSGTTTSNHTLHLYREPVAEHSVICDHDKSLYCDDTTSVCVTRAAELGSPCESIFYCAGSLYCNAERVCAARLAPGATCANVFGECEGFNYCPAGRLCGTLNTLPTGAACENVVGEPAQCISEYCTNGVCESSLQWLCGAR